MRTHWGGSRQQLSQWKSIRTVWERSCHPHRVGLSLALPFLSLMASRKSVGNGQFPSYFRGAGREPSLCSGVVLYPLFQCTNPQSRSRFVGTLRQTAGAQEDSDSALFISPRSKSFWGKDGPWILLSARRRWIAKATIPALPPTVMFGLFFINLQFLLCKVIPNRYIRKEPGLDDLQSPNSLAKSVILLLYNVMLYKR